MAIDFPAAPGLDQLYSEAGKIWKWNGLGWQLEVEESRPVHVGETPPVDPEDGWLWFRTDRAELFVWYDDGTSAQWVEANTGSSGGGGGGSEWFPSVDANNTTVIGTDGGIYTPTPLDPDLGSPVQLLETNVDLYVATTGNDTTGDGTQALPWATPHRAMAYLSKVVLADGVIATVYVADGDYTFTQSLNLGHPQGTQIFINGTSTTGTRPTGAGLNGGAVRGNTTATESFNNTKLRAYYNTRWQFNGCTGLFAAIGGGVTVDKALIRGNATASTYGVLTTKTDITAGAAGYVNLGATVAVHNFGGYGIAALQSGSINAKSVTSTNHGAYSFVVTGGGLIFAEFAHASNSQRGISTSYGGTITANSAWSSYHTLNGVDVNYGGTINFRSGTANNNGEYGIYLRMNGTIDATGSTATNNPVANITCMLSGVILATGANYGTSISPAINTVGNGNAYIAT